MVALLSLVVGWFLLMGAFVLVMHAKRLRDEGTKITLFWRVNLLPWAVLGLVLDLAFNVVAGTLLFREFPRELLFTSRCKRHIKGEGRRQRMAAFWARQLNQFDPGHV